MQKIFCDLCGKELEKTTFNKATFLDEMATANKKRALRITAIMEVDEYKGSGYDTKFYPIFGETDLCVECGNKLKTKIEFTMINEFLQGVDKK